MSLWSALVKSRAEKPACANWWVRILANLDNGEFEITVQDQGEGFDHQNLPNPMAEENLLRPNGRGIFIARQQFDDLEYLGRRNVVRARRRLNAAAP